MSSPSNHKPSSSTVEIERLGFKFNLEPQYDLSLLSMERRIQVRDPQHFAPTDAVWRFSVQMAHSEFPPILVTKDGWIIDGNTRVGACTKRGQKFFPAYVIDVEMHKATNAQVNDLVILGATLNSQNGNPLTSAEARRDVQACLNRNWKTEEICRSLGVKANVVSQVRKEMEADAKLAKVGTNGVTGSTKRALGEKNALALNDAPYRELAVLAHDAGLNATEIRDLVKEAQELGSDSGAVALLESARNEMADRIRYHALTGNGGTPTAVTQVKRGLGYITKYAEDFTEAIEQNESAIGAYLDTIDQAITVLQAIAAAHAVAQAA